MAGRSVSIEFYLRYYVWSRWTIRFSKTSHCKKPNVSSKTINDNTNMKIFLEDVFKTSGTPTYTFVRPVEYTKLIVALRTKGRGLVVEGPSGIGKT